MQANQIQVNKGIVSICNEVVHARKGCSPLFTINVF